MPSGIARVESRAQALGTDKRQQLLGLSNAPKKSQDQHPNASHLLTAQ